MTYLDRPLRTERQARLDALKARKQRWEDEMFRRELSSSSYFSTGQQRRDMDELDRIEAQIKELEG